MLYKRGDTWYADITTANGKRIRRTLGTTNKQAAEELHDKLKYQQWRIDRIGEKPKHSWDEACIRWLKEKGHKKSIEEDKRMIRQLTVLRGMMLDDITRDLVMNAVANFGETPATKNRHISIVRAILNRAMKQWEWIDSVPYFTLYKEPKRRIRWLTPDEAKRLIEVLQPSSMADMVLFTLQTGLRLNNVLRLEKSQIDLNRKVLWYHGDNMKSGKPLGVALNSIAVSVLERHWQHHPQRIFVDDKGKPMERLNRYTWKKALNKAGISDFRWHDLRHTWASWLIQRGVPLAALQEMGGWETPSMVQRYAHLAPEHLHRHAEILNSICNDF